jgi:hypothetical protein
VDLLSRYRAERSATLQVETTGSAALGLNLNLAIFVNNSYAFRFAAVICPHYVRHPSRSNVAAR